MPWTSNCKQKIVELNFFLCLPVPPWPYINNAIDVLTANNPAKHLKDLSFVFLLLPKNLILWLDNGQQIIYSPLVGVHILAVSLLLGPTPGKTKQKAEQSHLILLSPHMWRFVGPQPKYKKFQTLSPLLNSKLVRFGPL